MIDILIGIAVADALGVPVEFQSREELDANPVKDMRGYGTYNQPVGTWSDDSSLAFCLADSLSNGYNLRDIANKFQAWYQEALWTPHGEVFDIGNATRAAINRLIADPNLPPNLAGGTGEYDNGNGSLMRILPLLVYTKTLDNADQRYRVIQEVSSITHAHFRSFMSCFIYMEIALAALTEKDKHQAYQNGLKSFNQFLSNKRFNGREIALFRQVLSGEIHKLDRSQIRGSGYVLHSLEASLWCWLNTDNYKDAALLAVNLGEDTDTTAAITGGLAALTYGLEGIPSEWIDQLAQKEAIFELGRRFEETT